MSPLVLLIIMLLVIYLGVNGIDAFVHRSDKEPLEDLRLAYAPDLIQVFRDQDFYEQRREQEARDAYKQSEKETWELYERQLVDARIKRWLEGNPVTDENPLTKKEQPIPPYQGSAYYY